ncbi:ABC-type amino acid transport substrate-binding protein [Sinosporangium album]|uniref:ABC-type amino acid transport substrate-binding protein n=1 Tax=Sinosporangium album TaxID=504805 RepID=A0A1G8I8U5_9ACTN|nr:transporter substrate-binding domain-containing protein [Sinosporangium album]SDI15409.1 ABC-type amino acid transport substrate-binding protein [Sinosporangium album]
MTDPKERFLNSLAGLRPTGLDGDEALAVLAEETGLLPETVERIWAGNALFSWEVTAVYVHACGESTSAWFRRWKSAAEAEGMRTAGSAAYISAAFPDPAQATTLDELRALMNKMRLSLGRLSYRALEERSAPPEAGEQRHAFPYRMLRATTLNSVMRGRGRLTGEVIEGFAAACGLPQTEVRRWGLAYERITAASEPAPLPDKHSANASGGVAVPAVGAVGRGDDGVSRRQVWRWLGGAAVAGAATGSLATAAWGDRAEQVQHLIVRTPLAPLFHTPVTSTDDQDGRSAKGPTSTFKVSELDENVIRTLASANQHWFMDLILHLSHSRAERLANYSYYGSVTYRLTVDDGVRKEGVLQPLARDYKTVQVRDIDLGVLSSALKEIEVVVGFQPDRGIKFRPGGVQAANVDFDLLLNPGELTFHNRPFTETGRAASAAPTTGDRLLPSDGAATSMPRTWSVRKVQGRRLRVGFRHDLPGVLTPADTNTVRGFEYELADVIANELGPVSLEVEQIPSGERENRLLDGSIDMLICTYSITERRRDRVLFAGPYLVTKQAVMVRADDTEVRKFDDLFNRRMAYVEGSTSYERLKTIFGQRWMESERRTKLVTDYRAGARELAARPGDRKGTASAISTDIPILIALAHEMGADRFKIIGELPSSEEWGIGLHPRNPCFDPEELNELLKRLINTTWWEKRVKKYFDLSMARTDGSTLILADELMRNSPVIP